MECEIINERSNAVCKKYTGCEIEKKNVLLNNAYTRKLNKKYLLTIKTCINDPIAPLLAFDEISPIYIGKAVIAIPTPKPYKWLKIIFKTNTKFIVFK